jgi:hypothetical protein
VQKGNLSMMSKNPCDNLNHRRERVTIRNCPTCGEVLNDHVAVRRCGEAQHATARSQRSAFCTDCGTPLATER